MQKEVSISIALDQRRAKASGKYPVRLRVFTSQPRVQKLYATHFDMTTDEFHSTWETVKPRTQFKEVRRKLLAIVEKANEVCDKLDTFTFEAFEKKMYRKPGAGTDVFYQYAEAIAALKKTEQVGTADVYELSMKAVRAYMQHSKKGKAAKLTFYDITPGWLNGFERYMINEKSRTYTTVSIYVRALRTLFNTAIRDNEIPKELYPFGLAEHGKYEVPATAAVKKDLTHEQLKALYHAEPMTPEQERAKDFWFLSYACNGMNMKDIALLRYSNIKDGKISFLRAKTIRIKKRKQMKVVVIVTDFIQALIDKYGKRTSNPEGLVFSIIDEGMNATEQQKHIKNFTRAINQNLKLLALANDLPGDISTYWARHSFATNAIEQGASMIFVSRSLGHGSMSTTNNYFAGFTDAAKKGIQEKLTAF